jgi:hypothetical protein
VRPYERLTSEQEADRILSVCGDRYDQIVHALDVQFRIMHNRAQVLLAICGVLLSTSVVLMTGKIISPPDLVHRQVVGTLLIGAGTSEIAAAAIVVGGVLSLRWSSQLPGDNAREWILTSLRYRDSKTNAYRVATFFILLSMVLFQAAGTIVWLEM